ncbi:hypothetical protein NKY68_24805 [Sinorhizobium meliloti]|uniref:hypothetical protein n=1 Tax=Rhizobium meliloti TaxID=382 RepID=UPI00299ED11C
MLYWVPRLVVSALAVLVLGMGLFPRTPEDVAYTLLIIIGGLGLLSATLHLFRLSNIEQRFAGGILRWSAPPPSCIRKRAVRRTSV